MLHVERPALRGIVTFADPVERRDPVTDVVAKRSHTGRIYRALGSSLRGRSLPRHEIMPRSPLCKI